MKGRKFERLLHRAQKLRHVTQRLSTSRCRTSDFRCQSTSTRWASLGRHRDRGTVACCKDVAMSYHRLRQNSDTYRVRASRRAGEPPLAED